MQTNALSEFSTTAGGISMDIKSKKDELGVLIQLVVDKQREIAKLNRKLAAIAVSDDEKESPIAIDILVSHGRWISDDDERLGSIAKQGSLGSVFDEPDDENEVGSMLAQEVEYVKAAISVEPVPSLDRPIQCAECKHEACEVKNQYYRHAHHVDLRVGMCCPLVVGPNKVEHGDGCRNIPYHDVPSVRRDIAVASIEPDKVERPAEPSTTL